MAFTTIGEFKKLADKNLAKACLELRELEAAMRQEPPKDHQAAHAKWQLIIAADAYASELTRAKAETDA